MLSVTVGRMVHESVKTIEMTYREWDKKVADTRNWKEVRESAYMKSKLRDCR